MNKPKIDTIIFDLGGVLVDWNPDYLYQNLIPNLEKRQYFYQHVCPSWWNENQDAGYPVAQAMADRVALYPDWATEINAYYGRWPEMLGQPIQANVQILDTLLQKASHKILALTNWSHETMPMAKALDRFSFLDSFHGMVVSGNEKTRKPFHDFYQILFDRYQVQPQTSVFIDDNPHNIEAGLSLGMHCIQYLPHINLKAELAKLGISL
jgi:2-haloacid dehalogenase